MSKVKLDVHERSVVVLLGIHGGACDALAGDGSIPPVEGSLPAEVPRGHPDHSKHHERSHNMLMVRKILKLRGISGEMLKTAWRGNFRRLLALNRDIMLPFLHCVHRYRWTGHLL